MADKSITPDAVQRRHSQRRKRAYMAQPAAAEVADPGLLWLLRHGGLHPRPGQPSTTEEIFDDGLRYRLDREPGWRPAAVAASRCRRATSTIPVFNTGAAHARSGGRRRLLHARLPAGVAPDCRGDRPGDQGCWRAKAQLPPAGSVIGAGDSTVCDECAARATSRRSRVHAHPRSSSIPILLSACWSRAFSATARRPAAAAARSARSVGAACIGCYGPAEGVVDYGARLMTAVASVIDSRRSAAKSSASSTASSIRPAPSIVLAWPTRCCTPPSRPGITAATESK